MNGRHLITISCLAFSVMSLPVNSEGWSSDGNFELANRAETIWKTPKSTWKKTRFFELSVPGELGKRSVLTGRVGDDQTKRLLIFLGSVEAPFKGYNSVHHKAQVKPPALPTQMTIGQIQRWIQDTPRQMHAIGKYQFIPETLGNLVKKLGVSKSERFTPALQDRLAMSLLNGAGYRRFLNGEIKIATFQDNLARVWAGLPLESGKSAYCLTSALMGPNRVIC